MWDLINSCTARNCTKPSIPNSFIDEHGNTLHDKHHIADLFNKHFISIGEKLKNEIPNISIDPLENITSNGTCPRYEPTDSTELHTIIGAMKNVGGGIDSINSKIFKNTYSSIINELVHLVNICLSSGTFPEILKIAIVKPVFKSGDKNIFNNYRPISILPYISKVLEKIIHKRIMDYLTENDILCKNQFGFQKSLSTYMPILLLQERVTKAMENGKLAVAIYIDLQKAFDTVNHNILIGKCEKYGISGSALNLLKSYLTNRKQCVEYQEVRSALEDVTLGVPQGSILGPLLFLLYINDLPNACANSECLLYADDTAIIFESKNIVELQQTINDELRTLNKWLQSNQLSLNTKKTVYQLYSQTRSQISLDLKVNNDTIQLVEKVKYLGVMIDPCLNWKYHIDGITAIISRNIGVINRAKFYLDKHCLTLLYNSLVLPYINYCCLIWGFTFPSYLLKIELLQKRAIRILDNQHRIAHTAPIFRELKILKVGEIAKQQLLVLMHRKLTSSTPILLEPLFTVIDPENLRTRNRKHFVEPFTAKVYRTRVATWEGPRLWNRHIAPYFSWECVCRKSKQQLKNYTKEYFLQNLQ